MALRQRGFVRVGVEPRDLSKKSFPDRSIFTQDMENKDEVIKLTVGLWYARLPPISPHAGSHSFIYRDKLTPGEFAKAEKIFHERVAIALGSEQYRISVLRRLRERLHQDSADSWKKEFHGCKHSRLYLCALCRPLGSAHNVQAPKRAKAEEELSIVTDCVTQILAHGSSSFEQFSAECPVEFCNMAMLITQQSSAESVPSLALFSRALAKCSSDTSIKFMISTFHSWHIILINLMKKKEDCINGSLMQMLARLSSKEDYCRLLVEVERPSDLVDIANCVVRSIISM